MSQTNMHQQHAKEIALAAAAAGSAGSAPGSMAANQEVHRNNNDGQDMVPIDIDDVANTAANAVAMDENELEECKEAEADEWKSEGSMSVPEALEDENAPATTVDVSSTAVSMSDSLRTNHVARSNVPAHLNSWSSNMSDSGCDAPQAQAMDDERWVEHIVTFVDGGRIWTTRPM
jgi:hypothetical protein